MRRRRGKDDLADGIGVGEAVEEAEDEGGGVAEQKDEQGIFQFERFRR